MKEENQVMTASTNERVFGMKAESGRWILENHMRVAGETEALFESKSKEISWKGM